MTQIPSEIVEKYYDMNPQTEDLVKSKNLRNGMIVLIEETGMRQLISDIDLVVDQRKLQMNNRWSAVSDLEVNEAESWIHFISVYSDGTKRSRLLPLTVGWLVKKDSIPDEPPTATNLDKFEQVRELVKRAMVDPNTFVLSTPETPGMKMVLDRSAQEILDLFPSSGVYYDEKIKWLVYRFARTNALREKGYESSYIAADLNMSIEHLRALFNVIDVYNLPPGEL